MLRTPRAYAPDATSYVVIVLVLMIVIPPIRDLNELLDALRSRRLILLFLSRASAPEIEAVVRLAAEERKSNAVAPGTPMQSANPRRELVPSARDAQRPVSPTWGKIDRAAEGQ